MRSLVPYLILTATLLSSLAGCHIVGPGDLPVLAENDPLPAVQRGVQLDAARIPSYRDVKTELDAFKLATTSRPLTAAEAACLAASKSQVAAVLEKEAANTQRDVNLHHRRGPSELLPGILRDRAEKERNDAAEEALLAYYQLAEVHLQNAVLADGYQELDSVQQTFDGLIAAGVPVDVDRTELARRRAELDRRNAELDMNETRLSTHLKTLMDDDPFSPESLETTCSIEPRRVGYDLPEAMSIARANDFELKSINKLLRRGKREDLDLARGFMQTASPLLGQAPGPIGFLAKMRAIMRHHEDEEEEMRLRKQQLRSLHNARQKQVDLEVANGVVGVQQGLLEVGIAKDVFSSWDNRVAVLSSQRELQKSNYRDLVDAKVARLQAESDLVHKLILLELEHAKLRATMGLLVQECALQAVEPSDMQWAPHHNPCRVLQLDSR